MEYLYKIYKSFLILHWFAQLKHVRCVGTTDQKNKKKIKKAVFAFLQLGVKWV